MGGAVSSGRDNNELVDNLMGGNYVRSRSVERVFRSLDRAEYMTPEARDQAYKDLAWRNGPLHLSAPCIYSEVMEGLELRAGMSFLNVGSGTGYLSTLVGLILGSGGISHGVEVHPFVVEYANKKMGQFLENSPCLDEFDFCEPKFYCGNGLCLAPQTAPYDRVYCGAGCPEEYQNYFKQLIKVGGILVMPLNDNLLQIKRTGATEWSTRSVLNVSFATLRVPEREEIQDPLRLECQTPPLLQALCRSVVRSQMRGALRRRHPELRDPPPTAPPAKKACPRRICIPIDEDSDTEGLNALHDLDRASGANEMNALLSLVLSMGHNRVAGALRVDALDDDTSSEDDGDRDGNGDDDDGDDDRPDSDNTPMSDTRSNRTSSTQQSTSASAGAESDRDPREESDRPLTRSVIMFEFRDQPPPAPAHGHDTPHHDTEDSTQVENESADKSVTGNTKVTDKDDGDNDQAPELIDNESTLDSSARSHSSGLSSGSGDNIRDKTHDKTRDKTHDKTRDRRGKTAKKGKGNVSKWRPKRRDSESNKHVSDGDNKETPSLAMPAEVEIYLGKSRDEPGTSMEWDRDKREHSSDEDTRSTPKTKDEKRQKFDSGLGEENTPTSGSSPSNDIVDSDVDESHRSDSPRDAADDVRVGRKRRAKRRHVELPARSSSSGDDVSSESSATRRAHSSTDARRVRLSILMKRGVKELPLPYALKKYVNLNRCFEF